MSFQIRLLSLLLIFSIGISSCGKKTQSKKDPISISLDDAVTQQILNIRSKRNAFGQANVEAIKTFLAVENPTHRYMAALSLASIQDTTCIDALADALSDPYDEVRRVAAFSLGQTKSAAAAKILTDAFRNDSVRTVQAAILEAVGRCGTINELKSLCVANPYPIQDSLLQEGFALALYRFALRKMVQPEGTDRIMKDFISNPAMPAKARFAAANYMARVPDLDLSAYEDILINNVESEKDPHMLMLMVMGLAKTKKINALKTLENTFIRSNDYRVKCQIIRGLNNFPYDSCTSLIKKAFSDFNSHVKVTAADFLINYGKSAAAIDYMDLAEKEKNWIVRTKLMAAAMKNTEAFKPQTKALISTKLTERYSKSKSEYEKAEILNALSHFAWNYRQIADAAFPAVDSLKISPIIKSNAAAALVSIYSNPKLDLELGFASAALKADLHLIFKKIIESADVGAIAIVAELIANEQYNFKATYSDYEFIKTAQKKLTLPRDIETHIYLQNALDYLSGNKGKSKKASGTYVEIDWHFINALGKKPKVAIETNRGKIVLELYPNEAPATVMQFVNLINLGYYDNRPFHRVVPNFVVQTGCSRGDGWSGFDVNVVTEISMLRYTEAGRVGMASAGKDTESAQFFITHAPTIHLDGNYTIFAQVIEGMDIVHKLEIGDVVNKVVLLK